MVSKVPDSSEKVSHTACCAKSETGESAKTLRDNHSHDETRIYGFGSDAVTLKYGLCNDLGWIRVITARDCEIFHAESMPLTQWAETLGFLRGKLACR